MSKVVKVNLGDRAYNICVGCNLAVGTTLAGELNVKALVVSDSNVAPVYGKRCLESLRIQGVEADLVSVPAGEGSKDLRTVRMLYDKALECGLERGSVIIALGGGMVGDLAGFVSATFLRGVRLIQVPTSLLAMVDSSVGGKTGVNLPQGKNLIGAFHQPIEVVADLTTLKSLPEREYVSGIAEIVKYGVIWDRTLFEQVENGASEIMKREYDLLENIVERCCAIKAEIVAIDEKELGLRAILNFGHTIGHAIEKISGFSRYLHGEAVSIGMACAAELSVSEKGFHAEERDRLIKLLSSFGLPVTMKKDKPTWEKLKKAMLADKKTQGRKLKFVLAQQLGAVDFGCDVADEAIRLLWTESV